MSEVSQRRVKPPALTWLTVPLPLSWAALLVREVLRHHRRMIANRARRGSAGQCRELSYRRFGCVDFFLFQVVLE